MDKKIIALGLAALMTTGVANAELKAFKVNGETVTVAQQKALYNSAVAQGQPAGENLERMVRNTLTQETVLLQEAKKAKVDTLPDVKAELKALRSRVLVAALANEWVKKHPVSEAEIKAAYDQQKKAYGDTEYDVRHILVKTEDQAKNLINRLNKGANFDKLAREFSQDNGSKDKGGELGWMVPRSAGPALGAAFSALKPGSVAQAPVRTQYGFHVVKLEAKRAAKLFPAYETQKQNLRAALANQRVQQHFAELIKSAKVQ